MTKKQTKKTKNKKINKKKLTKCVKDNFETLKQRITNPTHLVHKVWSI